MHTFSCWKVPHWFVPYIPVSTLLFYYQSIFYFSESREYPIYILFHFCLIYSTTVLWSWFFNFLQTWESNLDWHSYLWQGFKLEILIHWCPSYTTKFRLVKFNSLVTWYHVRKPPVRKYIMLQNWTGVNCHTWLIFLQLFLIL